MDPQPSAPPSASAPRWPALDGLRGLAVAAVVAYHLGHLRGGYLGVDLFFVLSGFLITNLLLREHQRTGAIALGAFWLRRARRLLPALAATLVGVTVAARVVLEPSRLPSLRGDALAAGAYVANWRFALGSSTGYFADAAASPLRHTWSLAIEEQYYVLWPLVVAGALAVARRRGWSAPRTVAIVAGAGAALSAGSMAVHATSWPLDRLYLGTDTRALAPLLGALLAAVLTPWTTPRRARVTRARSAAPAVLGTAGLVALTVAVATQSAAQAWMYRGGFVLASLAAAAAITGGVLGPRWFTGALAVAPLRWLGERSYGLYLYSWPVQVLAEAQGTPEPWVPLVTVALAATLAEASYRWLEMPIRRRGHRAAPATAPAVGAGASPAEARPRRPRSRPLGLATLRPALAVLAVAAIVVTGTETSARPDALTTKSDAELHAEALAPALAPPAPVATTAPAGGIVPDDGSPVTAGGPDGAPADPAPAPVGPLRVLVTGDSVGYTIGTYAPGDDPDLVVDARAIVGCGLQLRGDRPPGMVEAGAPATYDECADLVTQADALGLQAQPEVVLLVTGGWELIAHQFQGALRGPGDPVWAAHLQDLLRTRLEELTRTGARVGLWAETCALFPEQRAEQRWYRDEVLAPVAAERADTELVDPGEVLCGAEGSPRTDVPDIGDPRTDGAHFSEAGAHWFWSTWLAPRLREVARG